MEIKIEDYLDKQEIKEIVQDELRNQIRKFFSGSEKNTQRLLSNLAYNVVSEEIEKIVPNYEKELIKKVTELINNKDSIRYRLFDFDYDTGQAKSLGAKIVENTIKENQQLIKDKVIDTIQNSDYTDEVLMKFENLAESFTSNIYHFVEMMRTKKE